MVMWVRNNSNCMIVRGGGSRDAWKAQHRTKHEGSSGHWILLVSSSKGLF